jgi:phage baseplate assembly protein W
MAENYRKLEIDAYGRVLINGTVVPEAASTPGRNESDKITKKFSDLDLDFTPHPISGDIIPLTDSAAIKRSIRNILFTGLNERLFNPEFGANLKQLLFEPINPGTKQTLILAITNSIKVFEPRATLVDLKVKVSPDENAYEVSLVVSIDNISEMVTYDLFLERLR